MNQRKKEKKKKETGFKMSGTTKGKRSL